MIKKDLEEVTANGLSVMEEMGIKITPKKRFNIVKSKLVENAHFIEDGKKQFTFPTLVGDKRALIAYEKALNELSEENASIKGRIIDAMVKSNQVECNCTTCVCEDYVNEELKKW